LQHPSLLLINTHGSAERHKNTYNHTMSKKHQQKPDRSYERTSNSAKTDRAYGKADPGHYPAAEKSYRGLYAGFDPCGEEGKTFLSGAEGIIGTELVLRQSHGGLELLTVDGRLIGIMERRDSGVLKTLLTEDWIIHCRLAYTLYVAEKKAFSAVLACFCYAPWVSEEYRKALERFIDNMADRIGSATHPSLNLSQEQFNRVLDSGGEWYLTKDEPWPELPRGSVYYRRKKTFKDQLIGIALKGNKGCLIASWAATFVIIAAIIYAIWYFFL